MRDSLIFGIIPLPTLRYNLLRLLVCLLFPSILICRPGKGSGNGTRLHFGPAYGFYRLNKNHAVDPVQRMSLVAGFRREFRVDRSYRSYLSFGFDYFLHGVNFRSYYFQPDSLRIYDKTYPYKYSLFVQELCLPVQFKYLFQREDNSLFSPYATAGYQFRMLLPGKLKVTRDGELITNESPDMKFRHHLLGERINAAVTAGLGWQRSSFNKKGGSFFVELNFRYGFSQYYIDADYTPSSLYINSTHLQLLIGLKF
jgi:hypothetical protein